MKRRGVLPVAALAVLAVIAASLAIVQSRPSHTLPDTGGKAFPGLAAQAGDAQRILITSSRGSYALAKQDGHWVLPDKADYPADSGKVGAFLATLADMDLLEPKTADPARYADLSLGRSRCGATGAGKSVTIGGAGGLPLAAAIFGKAAPSLGRTGGGLYLRRAGEAQSWLASGLPTIPDTAERWMDRSLFDLSDATAIKTATITDADGKTVLAEFRDKPADVDFSARQALPGKPDPSKLDSLGATPVSLEFDDVRARPADATPTRTITFERFDGGTYKLTLYTIGKDVWTAATQTGAGAAGFNAVHARYLFRLPPYRMSVLQGTLGRFRDPQRPRSERSRAPGGPSMKSLLAGIAVLSCLSFACRAQEGDPRAPAEIAGDHRAADPRKPTGAQGRFPGLKRQKTRPFANKRIPHFPPARPMLPTIAVPRSARASTGAASVHRNCVSPTLKTIAAPFSMPWTSSAPAAPAASASARLLKA